ncbi:MAG: hypothetical protein GMKNLPBB_00909 [Myxococcota bacterium]|nr:hypothetical protein [Myxococcota bacterium]
MIFPVQQRLRAALLLVLATLASCEACGFGVDPETDRKKNTLAAASAGSDQLEVRRTTGPIAVDGVLNEADWKGAASTGLFVRSMRADPSPPELETTARLLWDDAFLYVAFEVQDTDVWSGYGQRDEPIFDEEVAEIYIDADNDQATYHEFQISPANVLFDAYFEKRRSPDWRVAAQYNANVKSAVRVDGALNERNDRDRGWTAELAIPFAELKAIRNIPPKPGDRFRGNLYRIDRKEREGGGVFAAWRPLSAGDFHLLQDFGFFVFSDRKADGK